MVVCVTGAVGGYKDSLSGRGLWVGVGYEVGWNKLNREDFFNAGGFQPTSDRSELVKERSFQNIRFQHNPRHAH